MDWLVIEKEIAKQIKLNKQMKSKELRLHIINYIYVNYKLNKTITNIELFKIIKECDINYTKNNNGIFLNLNWISKENLVKINNYILFCIKSQNEIYKYDEVMKNLLNDTISNNLIEKKDTKLIILDNLMALSLDGYDGDKNSKQQKFILNVCSLAKEKNVHIIMVAHPRKQNDFLRKESISGTADLTNAVDNVVIVHRVNMDFQTRGKLFFGENKVAEMMKYGNVIEVCKNRSLGVVDLLVGMYYEVETRRFKNEVAEHINYGWIEQPVQQTLTSIADIQSIYDNANTLIVDDNIFKENTSPLPF